VENRAVVEFAIYQKLPKEHKKLDPRQGTIETDPDYLAFLESLKAEESQQANSKEPGAALEGGATQLERLETRLSMAAASSASNAAEKPTSTPLLDHLRAQKSNAKSKSPPPKQLAILSPPGSPAKVSGPKAKQTRAAQTSDVVGREEGMEENEQEKNKELSDQNKDKEMEAAKAESPVITILTKSQSPEDVKFDTKEKESKRGAPVKITIQQRQKDQIRQIIQRPTTPSVKKDVDAADKPTEVSAKESIITPSESSPEVVDAPSSAPKEHAHNRRRERDRNRKQSASVKQPVQIQILTKSQSKDISAEDNTSISNEPPSAVSAPPDSEATGQSNSSNTQPSQVTNNMPPPSRRNGRGYFSKRGRW
ncbi:3432_t:CDS:2, partial [Acaulospora colombiana]